MTKKAVFIGALIFALSLGQVKAQTSTRSTPGVVINEEANAQTTVTSSPLPTTVQQPTTTLNPVTTTTTTTPAVNNFGSCSLGGLCYSDGTYNQTTCTNDAGRGVWYENSNDCGTTFFEVQRTATTNTTKGGQPVSGSMSSILLALSGLAAMGFATFKFGKK